MALTSFDGTFSFRQEELARMGGHEPSQMTAAQWEEFQNSPFMKSMRKAEAVCYEKTVARDQERGKRDPEFKPEDGDWTAPKAFDYDKGSNYYRMLGVDDLASLQEIKQAYKKLSLIYHPDKTAGMTQKEKEEHNLIFIELKNAYKTLSDQATRRQYDRERDRDFAVLEVNGWKPKHKRGFDATEVLKKLQEEQKNPGKTIDIPIECKLEKFFWGGHKSHRRERKLKDFVGFTTEEKTFRLDVPKGASEPLVLEFKHAGDHQEDMRPDTLRFVIASKPHPALEREGNDLLVRQHVPMRPDAHTQPYLSGQVDSVRGSHIVFWGRNPFFRATGSGGGELAVRVRGQGVSPEGCLRFFVKLGASANTEDKIVVRLKQLNTGAEMAMRLPKTATIGDVQSRARVLLDFLGSQNVKIMKAEAGGHVPYPEEHPVGSQRSFECGGTAWSDVPITYDSALTFLYSVIGMFETDAFQASLAEGYRLVSGSKTDAQKHVEDLWMRVCDLLPDYGFDQSIGMLKKAVNKALGEIENDQEHALLVAKVKKLLIGFDPDAYANQEGAGRKARGLTNHPLMVGRAEARLKCDPRCEVELAPLLPEPVALYTKPGCGLMFYSNAGQAACPPPGCLRPRLMFAVSISCPAGSKKAGSSDWAELVQSLAPLIEGSLFCFLRTAQGVLPKPIAQAAAFADDCYTQDEDVVVAKDGEELPEEEDDAEEVEEEEVDEEEEDEGEQEEDEDDDDCGGGGMFDFDDMEEAAEKKKKKAEAAARKEKRREAKRTLRRMLKRESKALERRAAAAETAWEQGARGGDAVPWRALGEKARKRGDNFLAAKYYSEQLSEQLEGSERAEVLVCRSASYAEVEHFDAAFDDARLAAELRPEWGVAWGCLGAAAARRGGEFAGEACSAYFKAVQYEPAGHNIDALYEVTRTSASRSAEKAGEERSKGNEAMKVPDEGLAIAHYTCAIAHVPDIENEEDPNRVLNSILFSNRSLAFARLRNWDAAVADGMRAVAASNTNTKAFYRLGTALLGVGQNEQAYSAFAKGLKLSPEDEQLRRGRETCLTLMPLWRSVPAMTRLRTRYSMDMRRLKASSKVYVMSDLHFDHKKNDEWVHHIDEFMFQEDVLIVAGNVADTLNSLVRALRALKLKFRRVFFTPGNHEMWIHPSEVKRFPDSIAKFNAIMEVCDELGVDVFPAPIAEDCYIVPLFSWYNAEFDEADPFPDPKLSFDAHCRWPMDVDQQVWRYFLHLNKLHLQLPYEGTVISFSHFLPRHGLPFDKAVPKIAKVMGCEELDEQVRSASLRSRLHVYGHARKKHAKADEGVMYISHSLGYENEHTEKEPMMLVYNGQSVCNRTVPIDKA
eukprot:CAMPEP_0179016220 /NCGR_PEP_ID=MMETSP0796-20121207/3201_1 /TAXON_ID=73915 /ORGANISM="Pyrodinium bahamense, Strain pbaha01" /LENGTH=1350 /DNA_ID=CAMNT_0020711891 /DNA_START=5 /DNA_END=4057 /DNA_ORIENTATION=+